MKNLRFTCIVIASVVLTYACKKGETGPAGPQGSVGPTGSPNVIYSAWTTSPTASRDTSIDGTCLRIRTLSAPLLDTTILKKGVMLCYLRVGSIGPYQMPYISDAGGATNEINCIYNLKKIFIYRHTFGSCRYTSASPGTEPVLVNLPQSIEYRYVLIPGGIPAGRLMHTNGQNQAPLNLNAMSYDAVMNALGIPENGSNMN